MTILKLQNQNNVLKILHLGEQVAPVLNNLSRMKDFPQRHFDPIVAPFMGRVTLFALDMGWAALRQAQHWQSVVIPQPLFSLKARDFIQGCVKRLPPLPATM